MLHRFSNSPGIEEIYLSINNLMDELGYDKNMQSVDYHSGNAAALGNYMANQIIAFGMQDGSNEENEYANLFYEPLNENLNTDYGGNPNLTEPNHWQALTIEEFIDQSGNYFPGGAPEFLSPEWGKVTPFSIKEEDLTIYNSTDYRIDAMPFGGVKSSGMGREGVKSAIEAMSETKVVCFKLKI